MREARADGALSRERSNGDHMSDLIYRPEHTALLFVDPYNDFLSEGGKLWPNVAAVAEEVRLLDNLRSVAAEVRRAGIRVFIVPHRRWEPGDFTSWDHATPYQLASAGAEAFAKGTWGGEWHPDFVPQPGDVIAKEHFGASGFANTDLDLLLKQHRIVDVIVVGLLANTCIEGTSRFATELGYRVTLVRDATAAFSPEGMHAAHELNAPTFAHAVVTTAELIGSLQRSAAVVA
jgi:nicotinamidase-related amidase